MFRRLFWFLTGAATGVWATTKVNRALRRLSPESLAATAADRALETGARLRTFAHDVRAGMTQREGELHDALGLTGADDPRRAAPRELDTDLPAPRRGIAYNAYDRKDDH
ncbi:DUF6167 family protein [Streptomyces cocklensis]|jgi:hypothetical protein|uniref:Secreted protein n=1 Tax=Actinacidiphila cocklensis TaxID=887465 RepID=A0A9W4DR37_9ACTN|nr:DUF6167 family protein [Actinacidiphila cocklensis]MDD1058969.1 DUF6167 family protein [Actinacidiphila cocklensis]CAG6394469.1 putative secreted protein [Actinacidiphila cocklensis]